MDILISLLVAVIIIGLIVYLVQILPLPDPWGKIAIAIVVIIAILWLLQFVVGGGPYFSLRR